MLVSNSKVFDHPFRVLQDDIDALGHMNNVAFLRYAQDAAVAHWLTAATKEQVNSFVWVARRHEIDYLRPAFKSDELIAQTWVGEASGATYERFVEIRRPKDGEVLAKVRTVWVLLDAKTLRPKRVTAELRARFEDGDRRG